MSTSKVTWAPANACQCGSAWWIRSDRGDHYHLTGDKDRALAICKVWNEFDQPAKKE